METQANSAIFENTDEADAANLLIRDDADRGTSAIIDYNDSAQTILIATFFADLDMDSDSVGGEWNSGEELSVTLVDQDLNLDTLLDEDLDVNNPEQTIIPSITIGSPIVSTGIQGSDLGHSSVTVDDFSSIVRATLSRWRMELW